MKVSEITKTLSQNQFQNKRPEVINKKIKEVTGKNSFQEILESKVL